MGSEFNRNIPHMRSYDFSLARDPLVFIGPASDDFAAHRLKSWAGFHPDIHRALRHSGITPAVAQNGTEPGHDLQTVLPNSADRRNEWHIIPQPTDPAHRYAIDAPLPGTTPRSLSISFEKVIARALDTRFRFSEQPGFTEAVHNDFYPGKRADAFATIWAIRFSPNADRLDIVRSHKLHRASWAWIERNAPSAANGFALNSEFINLPDRAHRTPLENLLFPVSSKGQPMIGLLPDELATVLKAGANPFQYNLVTDRSVVDDLMTHNAHAHLAIVIEETARKGSPIARYLTASVKSQLEDFVDFEFPAERREASLKALRGVPNQDSLILRAVIPSLGRNPNILGH